MPYNLFLHAAKAREFYSAPVELPRARLDLYASVGLGAVITLAIATLAAASTAPGTALNSGADLVAPLGEVLGTYGRYVVGAGYLAAGLTSAVTAPLATALAIGGLLAWERDRYPHRYRLVWGTVLLFGLAVVLLGARPVWLILTAQVANGLLLPVIAAIVLYMANDAALLGAHRNRLLANLLGGAVLLVTVVLGGKTLYSLL